MQAICGTHFKLLGYTLEINKKWFDIIIKSNNRDRSQKQCELQNKVNTELKNIFNTILPWTPGLIIKPHTELRPLLTEDELEFISFTEALYANTEKWIDACLRNGSTLREQQTKVMDLCIDLLNILNELLNLQT